MKARVRGAAPVSVRRIRWRRALAASLLALATGLPVCLEAAPPPPITVAEIASPAAAPATGPSFARADDGTIALTWIERRAPAPNRLRFSIYDSAAAQWRAAVTIAEDATVAASALDIPQLAFTGGGAAWAVWTDGHGGAFTSESLDGGRDWQRPTRWSAADAEVEKFSLQRLADGRVLAVWLDGRGRTSGGAQQVYSRVLGSTTEQRIDTSACDCCPTALTAFLDGGALVAYRGRSQDEIRDIRVARFRGGRWESPATVNPDRWRITACPMNGARLASDGSRVALAWFTASEANPRVLVSFSPDAGARWLMPLQIDRGHPVGHVDTVLLRDGAILVTWVESDGSLWMRRIGPDYTAAETVRLGRGSTKAMPRIALQRDYVGAASDAGLLVVLQDESPSPALHTLRVRVPEGALIAAERSCGCAPTPDELRGFAIGGAVTGIEPASSTVRLQHPGVPGVLPAGTLSCRVDAAVLRTLTPGRRLLGRIDREPEGWSLFGVRLLAEP